MLFTEICLRYAMIDLSIFDANYKSAYKILKGL